MIHVRRIDKQTNYWTPIPSKLIKYTLADVDFTRVEVRIDNKIYKKHSKEFKELWEMNMIIAVLSK